jgi:hypothetical protein
MYKLTITQLKALKESLVNSNKLLKIVCEEATSDEWDKTIKENEKLIKFITENFKIDE